MNDIRKIAFIGAGNMTQSIVGGMCKSGYPADHVFVLQTGKKAPVRHQFQCPHPAVI